MSMISEGIQDQGFEWVMIEDSRGGEFSLAAAPGQPVSALQINEAGSNGRAGREAGVSC